MKRAGYGQVEPNHLSGIVTGQIYAQLPAANTITQFENGQFAKYNYAAGQVDTLAATDGEYMLVYNEEKLYDERYQSHKDFVYKTADFTDKKLYPRLIRTYVGDIMTTNTIEVANTSNTADVTPTTSASLAVGNYLTVSATGFLTKAESKPASGMAWKVVKEYTMPDGQPGVKIQRVQ
jgi:hypothetical protein